MVLLHYQNPWRSYEIKNVNARMDFENPNSAVSRRGVPSDRPLSITYVFEKHRHNGGIPPFS
jgi:hypothetical protein